MKGFDRRRFAIAALAAAILLPPAAAFSQESRDVQVVHEEKPVYPEGAVKTRREGNVVVVGRIDEKGVLQDATPAAASLQQLVVPALTAAKKWRFRPASVGSDPVEVAANLAFQFRIDDAKRGENLPAPMLGDVRIVPADDSGRPSGPDGFPVRRGAGERIRVEAGLDVPPQELGRSLDVAVSAISPSGKVVELWNDRVTVGPRGSRAGVAFTAAVGPEWAEDGVWRLRFVADRQDAGTAIVWAAANPGEFDFAAAMKTLKPWTPPR